MALDRFGRSIHYLRISLTDHCNLRCVYCMPEDMLFRPNAELLQDDEILLLVRLFAQLGFDKLRLTGGEPTGRAHIVELVREVADRAGLTPIKINAVVVRGYNEADVVDLARLTLDRPWQVRFIEMMPFAGATDLQRQQMVTAGDTQARLRA